MTWFVIVTFYVAIVGAAYVIELAFGVLGLIPTGRTVSADLKPSISWNYTTWLNFAFLGLAAVLLVWFLRTDGLGMMRMMNAAPSDHGGDASPASGSDERALQAQAQQEHGARGHERHH